MAKRSGFLSIFSKYLFMEMWLPLLICLMGLTVMFTSSILYELTDMVIDKRVPIPIVLQIMIYRLPTILVMALPISVLFATIFSVGRLVKDNEMTSMRMAGYGIVRVLLPFLIIGCIITFSTYWVGERLAPWTNHQALNLVRQVMMKDVTPVIKENTFFRGPEDRYFYVRTIDHSKSELRDVMIYETRFTGLESPFPRAITAKTGRFREKVWELEDGVIHEFDNAGFIKSETKFKRMEVPISDGLENFFGNQKSAEEMSRDELRSEIQLFLKSGIRINSWEVEYNMKVAKPFICLIFVLVGVPLSLRNRKGWGVGVVFTFVIAFAYYITQSVCQSFGTTGLLQPIVSAWLPNVIFLVLGIFLLVFEEFRVAR